MEAPAARAADYARLVAVPAIWGGTFVLGLLGIFCYNQAVRLQLWE